MEVHLEINGEPHAIEAERTEALLDVLRRNGYTGAKRGCNEGSCGFCTVLIDGEAEKSCLRPATLAEGSSVVTVEGLGSQDDLGPVQQAFVDNAALQCGYCIPGMIMSARGLLAETPDPDEAEIREGLSDNLCRCTGYEKIVDAVAEAAENVRAEEGAVAADGGRVERDEGGRVERDSGDAGTGEELR